MNNEILDKCKKVLRKSFNVDDIDDNVIGVTFKDDNRYIALIITEDTYPDTALLSIAVDCHYSFDIAKLTLSLMHACNVGLAEVFYHSIDGQYYWGEEAYNQFNNSSTEDDLTNMESPSKLLN